MKKLLFTLTLVLVALAGCKKETQEPVPEQNEPAQEEFVITPAKDSVWAGGAIQISANREVASWSHEMVIPEVGDKANYSESSSLSTSISESGLVTLGMYLKRFAAKIFAPTTMTLRITATSVDGETATCEVASMGWATRFYLCSDEEVRNPEKVAVGDIVCIKFTDTSQGITDEEFLKNVKVIADNGQVKLTPVKREGNHFQYKVEKTTGGKITLQLGIKASYGAYTEDVSEVDVLLSTKKVSDISITMSKSEVKVGYMVRATATVSPEDATNREITWSSSNTAIAKVRAVEGANNKVDVIGVSPGSVIITATARDGSGVTASVPVTVIDGSAEGEGNDKPYITLIAEGEAPVSFIIPQSEENELELEGATILGEIYHDTGLNTVLENSLKDYTDFKYSMVTIAVTSADKKVKVYGKFTTFIPSNGYTSVDTKNNKDLKELVLSLSTNLKSLTVADDGALTYIDVTHTELTGTNATAFMNSLPTRAEADNAILYVEDTSTSDNPEFTDADKSIATGKKWKVSKTHEDPVYNNWISIGCGDHTKIMYAYVLKTEWATAEKGFQTPMEFVTGIEGAGDRYKDIEYKKYPLMQFYDDQPMLLKGDEFTLFVSVNTPMTHLDASNQKVLKELTLKGNSSLSDFKIASDGALEYLDIRGTKITGNVLNTVISSLPDRTGKSKGTLYADGLTNTQKATAEGKNWKINP